MALQDGAYTSETFKSNIFKLQVDELLDQVKLKYGKKEAPAENAMRTLKTIIEQIPGREPQSVIEAEKLFKVVGIMVPFPGPHPPKDAQYKLQYERPASINVTGSYPLKTVTRSDDRYAIDLVVTIPKSLLQEKDYLNHRYFYKRAYYLACIAAGIKQDKSHKFKLSFDCLNGNQLQPILIIRPSETGDTDDFTASKCQIQVLVALPEHTFQQAKILPNSNCVRPKTIEEDQTTKILKPTPFYNATLQSDANITAYLKLLHATAAKVDAYRDACILGRQLISDVETVIENLMENLHVGILQSRLLDLWGLLLLLGTFECADLEILYRGLGGKVLEDTAQCLLDCLLVDVAKLVADYCRCALPRRLQGHQNVKKKGSPLSRLPANLLHNSNPLDGFWQHGGEGGSQPGPV